jgi:hypothetical protein
MKEGHHHHQVKEYGYGYKANGKVGVQAIFLGEEDR